MEKNHRINSLEGLRVVAMLIIVLAHLTFLGELNNSFGSFYNTFLNNSVLGVDFFFVLSGFGMMLSFNKKPLGTVTVKNSVVFALKKIRFLYPLVLASFIPFIIYDGLSLARSGFSGGELFKFLAQLTIAPTLFQSASGISFLATAFNGVVWFFSCLFIIYLFSPAIMLFVNKRRTHIHFVLGGLIVSILLVFIFSFAFSYLDGLWYFDCFVSKTPYVRIWYVVFGMFLAILYEKATQKYQSSLLNRRVAFSVFESIIVLFCFLWFIFRNSISASAYVLRLIDVPLIGVLVFVFSFEQGFISAILSKKFFTRQAHYVPYVYIVHYPIKALSTNALKALGVSLEWYFALALVFFIILATIGLSVLYDLCLKKIKKPSKAT